MQRLLTALAAVALSLSFIPGASAQITGTIAGTVRDSSGAVLSGASVTVRGGNLPTDGRKATTSDEGTYRFASLPPGRYEVSAESAGFGRQTKRGVEVAIDADTRVEFGLSPAGVEEAVDVVSSAPVIDVERSAVANRITQQTIDSLPLNGREFVDLVRLVPGATPVSGDQQGGALDQVSVFGERASATSYLVDGGNNNDPLNGGPFIRYTQDSIQEFEVITTGYEAQFGRAQGGVANIVTRSGSNLFQGSAFLFARNDSFDSSNVPDQDPPELSRYQYGASLGGPIKKDKAFFFGTFELLDEKRGVNINQATIPDFVKSGIATPGGAEDFGIAPKTDRFNGMLKFDYNLNSNNRLFLQLNRSDEDRSGAISSPVSGTVALPSAAADATRKANSGILRHTAILSPQVFLESSATFIKGKVGQNLDRTERAEPLLLLLASGFLQTGAPFGGTNVRNTRNFELAQNLSWVKSGFGGNHELKAGWDWSSVAVDGSDSVVNDVEYSGAFLSPTAAADNAALFQRLGFQQSAARFFLAFPPPGQTLDVDIKDKTWGGFVQDRLKVNDRLTVNGGLRYDRSSLFSGDTDNFGPRLGFAYDLSGKQSTILKANWGRFNDRNLLTAAATVPEKGGIFSTSAFDVALPRLGSDYTDTLIDLVITSGFPIGGGLRSPAENPLYARFASDLRNDPLALYKLLGIAVPNPGAPPVVTADNIQSLSGLTPAQAIQRLETTYAGTDFEFFDVPGGSILGNRVLSFFPRGPLSGSRSISRYSEDKTPVTNAFTVGIDQKLTDDIGISATYVHRRSKDLLTRRIVNLFPAQQGDPNFGKTTDGGPRIDQVGYEGRIEYDGVAVALQKRYSKRYAFLVSYTYSSAKDNLLSGNVGSTFSDNNNPEKDFGPSNQSVPHNLVASGVVTLPLDINLSGIFVWRSGLAFNPRGIQDLDGDGLVDQRDTAVPRNNFRTKAFRNLDLRLEKVFKVAGRNSLSVLAEAFNVFNTDNVLNVTNVSGADFGKPTEFFSGREVQLGVRYLFGR